MAWLASHQKQAKFMAETGNHIQNRAMVVRKRGVGGESVHVGGVGTRGARCARPILFNNGRVCAREAGKRANFVFFTPTRTLSLPCASDGRPTSARLPAARLKDFARRASGCPVVQLTQKKAGFEH